MKEKVETIDNKLVNKEREVAKITNVTMSMSSDIESMEMRLTTMQRKKEDLQKE